MRLAFINPSQVYWDDWLLLGVQVLTLGFLVVYVVKTWQMASATRDAAKATKDAVEEARQARLDDVAPRFAVYFDSTAALSAVIVVENVGRGTARDVSFTFSPPLQNPKYECANLLLDQVQPILAPGYQLKHIFGAWPDYLKNPETPKEYEVTVEYEGVENGQSYKVKQVLSCNAVQERLLLEAKGVHHVAEATEKLNDVVQKLCSDLNRRNRNQRGRVQLPIGPDQDVAELALGLLATWDTYRFVTAGPRSSFPWIPVLDELRRHAFIAARAARLSHSDPSLRSALEEVILQVFDTHSEVLGNTDWFADAEKRFDTLRDVLDA